MLKILLKRWFLIPPLLLLVVVTPLFFFWFHIGARASQQAMTGTHHYFYDFPNGYMNVYDMDNNFALVQSVQLPTTNVRGVVFDPNSGMLYFSNGGNGGGNGNGGLIKYNLVTQQVVYNVSYNFGVDSMAITPDGKTIFMPDGSMSSDGTWHIIDTANGQVTGTLLTTSGLAPHDTDMSANGQYVYMEGVDNTYIWVANTATDQIVQKVGPFAGRARPFVVNQSGTLVYTTENGLIGFGVGNLQTGQVLYNVSAPGFNLPPGFDKVNVTPSHGISLSPDGKTVYVIDVPNSYVHVFDVSGLPSTAPTMTASIPISSVTGSEPNCHIDCTREGWLEQSLDGHYLFVGNSGSIIDTTTNKVVANLATLDDTRMFLEIDWVNGVPVNSEDRTDFYWNNPSLPTPTPSSTITPSPDPTPGTLLAQDTFQRANQKYWGTASDGLTWGGDANTLSTFSIANNTGQLSNGSGAYNAVLGPSTTDAEVLFTGSISSFTNNNLGAVLRWQNTNNWYKAYIDGSHLIIQSKVNGTLTTLTQVAFTAQANTLYNLRFRIVGSTLYAKAWAANTTEPTNWMATATSTALTSGQCGLRIQLSTNTTATVTSFQATSTSTSTPTATPSPTVTPSPTTTPSPSPTPGTLLAQDTFQRANQKYWGTASDGLTWGGDANTLSPFSIANNTGLISNSNGAYNAVLGPSTTDAEVLFTGSISSFTNNNLGAVLRWQNTNNWYKAYIDGSHLVIQSKVNGTYATLAQVAFTAQANTLYNLRFRIVGSTLYAKAWAASTTEPTNWMATATSTALASGQCGLRIQISTNTTATITSFQAISA